MRAKEGEHPLCVDFVVQVALCQLLAAVFQLLHL